MTEFPLFQVGVEFGGGGVLGFLSGWAVKKLAKVAAVVVGALVALLGVLEAEGLIVVRWGALREYVEATPSSAQLSQMTLDVIGVLPVGSGFALGAALGFRKG